MRLCGALAWQQQCPLRPGLACWAWGASCGGTNQAGTTISCTRRPAACPRPPPGLASLKYVRQMVDARAAPTISVRLSGEAVPEYRQAVAAARAAAAAAGADTSGDDEPLTAAETAQLVAQLERMNDQAAAKKLAAREEKLEQRRAYELDNLVRILI